MGVTIELGIDSRDPRALAPFWLAALGYERVEGDGNPSLTLVPPPGQPAVHLQRVPDAKRVKSRVRVELVVPDPEATARRLEGLGARRVGDLYTHADGSWDFQLMEDPEGNEFCLRAAAPGR